MYADQQVALVRRVDGRGPQRHVGNERYLLERRFLVIPILDGAGIGDLVTTSSLPKHITVDMSIPVFVFGVRLHGHVFHDYHSKIGCILQQKTMGPNCSQQGPNELAHQGPNEWAQQGPNEWKKSPNEWARQGPNESLSVSQSLNESHMNGSVPMERGRDGTLP